MLIPLAYFGALVAAALVMSVGIFGRSFFDVDVVGYSVAAIIGTTFFAGTISFLPALVIVIAAEFFGWRSLLFWLAAGGIVGVIASEVLRSWGSLDFVENLFILCLAAGFTGGFVYWLIAGRDAGLHVPNSSATTR